MKHLQHDRDHRQQDRTHRRNHGLFFVLAWMVLLAWDGSRAEGGAFVGIASFGDSLSDTGNLFDVTSNPINIFLLSILFPELDLPIPSSPYFNGQFSNGPVWINQLAERLDVSPPVPSETGGWNYAVGGATTFDDGNFLINLVIPDDVEDQVAAYLNAHRPSGNELFIVEGGANDLLSGGVTDATSSAENIVTFIGDLHAAGGRHFLVPNLPPLGLLPGERGGPRRVHPQPPGHRLQQPSRVQTRSSRTDPRRNHSLPHQFSCRI